MSFSPINVIRVVYQRSASWLAHTGDKLDILPFLEGIPYWLAAAVVGLIAVGYSYLFEEAANFARWVYHLEPYALFAVSPICFVISSWLVQRFGPAAGGSGVPQVARAIQQDTPTSENVEKTLNGRVAIVIALSSLICIMGAGSLGREGPMVHIAACVFFLAGQSMSRIWPFEEHRSWIIAGGAAGVAAAFNAPLAGVVFALEELADQHFKQFKTFVISAAIVGGATSQWLSGKYLPFGYAKIGPVPFHTLPWAALIGVLAGVIALPFHKIVSSGNIKRINEFVETRFSFSKYRLPVAALCGIVVAGIANFIDARSIGGGLDVIQEILTSPVGVATIALFAARFFGPAISHLSGSAGGFLAPSLALGAVTGSLLDTSLGYGNHNLSVMIGMAAALSATARAPFTAWVVVMEMTDRHSAIFPLMLASLASYAVVTLPTKIAAKRKGAQ